jgi:hypothetical protein
MKLKEAFKPTKGKIWWSIGLFVISFLIFYTGMGCVYVLGGDPWCDLTDYLFSLASLLIYPGFILFGYLNWTLALVLGVIVDIIWIYLLVCLVLWIFSKLRKDKKNKKIIKE